MTVLPHSARSRNPNERRTSSDPYSTCDCPARLPFSSLASATRTVAPPPALVCSKRPSIALPIHDQVPQHCGISCVHRDRCRRGERSWHRDGARIRIFLQWRTFIRVHIPGNVNHSQARRHPNAKSATRCFVLPVIYTSAAGARPFQLFHRIRRWRSGETAATRSADAATIRTPRWLLTYRVTS
jgi:hypothetical protein